MAAAHGDVVARVPAHRQGNRRRHHAPVPVPAHAPARRAGRRARRSHRSAQADVVDAGRAGGARPAPRRTGAGRVGEPRADLRHVAGARCDQRGRQPGPSRPGPGAGRAGRDRQRPVAEHRGDDLCAHLRAGARCGARRSARSRLVVHDQRHLVHGDPRADHDDRRLQAASGATDGTRWSARSGGDEVRAFEPTTPRLVHRLRGRQHVRLQPECLAAEDRRRSVRPRVELRLAAGARQRRRGHRFAAHRPPSPVRIDVAVPDGGADGARWVRRRLGAVDLDRLRRVRAVRHRRRSVRRRVQRDQPGGEPARHARSSAGARQRRLPRIDADRRTADRLDRRSRQRGVEPRLRQRRHADRGGLRGVGPLLGHALSRRRGSSR